MSKNQTKQRNKGREVRGLLDPKIDYVFKRIFGHAGNEDITKDLLSSIIKEKISDVRVDCNPITEKDLLDDKIGILDIKAKLNNNTNCNIEMQVVDKKNVEKRILFYWSKMYTTSIGSGDDYDKLEKSIVILFTDYNLKKLEKVNKFITKWNIREEENPKIILTDALEIYIIELSKGENILKKMNNKDISNNSLNTWLQFINNPEAIVDMNNKEVQKAKEILEEISQNEYERYKAELRQKYIMDQKATEAAGYDKGLEVGIEQGIQQGIERGAKEEKIKIAKTMKEKNVKIEDIMSFTGLSKEEIEDIS